MILKQQHIQLQNYKPEPNSFKSNGSKSEKDVLSIPLNRIKSPDRQPRRYFDEEAMEQLIASIKENGILQPLLVRPVGDKYELVAGERRLKAARTAGLTEVPVTVREMTDSQALQYNLVENLQRQDLNPVEETEGILQLLVYRLEYKSVDDVVSLLYRLENQAKGKTTRKASGNSDNKVDVADAQITQSALVNPRAIVEQLFVDLGRMKWRSFVSARLPLLKLPPEILEALRQGRIDYTKAKEIAKLSSEPDRVALLEKAIAESMTLRKIQKQIGENKASQKQPELQAEMADIFKKYKKFSGWDDQQKCDKIKSLLADLKLLLAEEN